MGYLTFQLVLKTSTLQLDDQIFALTNFASQPTLKTLEHATIQNTLGLLREDIVETLEQFINSTLPSPRKEEPHFCYHLTETSKVPHFKTMYVDLGLDETAAILKNISSFQQKLIEKSFSNGFALTQWRTLIADHVSQNIFIQTSDPQALVLLNEVWEG